MTGQQSHKFVTHMSRTRHALFLILAQRPARGMEFETMILTPLLLAAAQAQVRVRRLQHQAARPRPVRFRPRLPPGRQSPPRVLGSDDELRRLRVGVEGDLPGNFGYVFEIDLAGETAEIIDANLTWAPAEGATVTLGQHNNFQSLEELTSSRFTTFIERAAFTDAFNFERRVGLSATYGAGPLLVQGGLFLANIHDLDEDGNDSKSGDVRASSTHRRRGETQLHFGASAHYRSRNGSVR
jgi:hypothetical protein